METQNLQYTNKTTTTTKRFISEKTDGKRKFQASNAHNPMSTIQIARFSLHSPPVTYVKFV